MESIVVLVLCVRQCPQAALSPALSFTQSLRQRELMEIETFGGGLYVACSFIHTFRLLATQHCEWNGGNNVH